MIAILFVCLGNICRSPMAEFIMRDLIAQQGWQQHISTASAGTSGWHDGEFMHPGTAKILQDLHIEHRDFVSRRLRQDDGQNFDYLLAMDHDNLRELERQFGSRSANMFVITDLVPHLGYQGVPDPWYSNDFDETRRLLQDACAVFLQQLSRQHHGFKVR